MSPLICVTKGLTAALVEQLHGVGRDREAVTDVRVATENAVNVVRERAELILVDSVLGAGTASALNGDATLVSLETVRVSLIGQLSRSHSPQRRLPALAQQLRPADLLTQGAACSDGEASGAEPSPRPQDGQKHRCSPTSWSHEPAPVSSPVTLRELFWLTVS